MDIYQMINYRKFFHALILCKNGAEIFSEVWNSPAGLLLGLGLKDNFSLVKELMNITMDLRSGKKEIGGSKE